MRNKLIGNYFCFGPGEVQFTFPTTCAPSYVVEELAFWQITECKLAKCCWFWLKAHEMEYGIRDRIEKTFTGTHVSSRKMEYWQPKTKDIFVAAGAKVVFSRQGNEHLFQIKSNPNHHSITFRFGTVIL